MAIPNYVCIPCEICGYYKHVAFQCSIIYDPSFELANYFNNSTQFIPNDPFLNTYESGWSNYSNYPYWDNQSINTPSTKKSNLEIMLETFITSDTLKQSSSKDDSLTTYIEMPETQATILWSDKVLEDFNSCVGYLRVLRRNIER